MFDLDFDGRILNDNNPNGFLPGEGAGFVLLAGPNTEKSQWKSLGEIVETSLGLEKGHIYSNEPMRGDGLSETLKRLFSNVPENLLPSRPH